MHWRCEHRSNHHHRRHHHCSCYCWMERDWASTTSTRHQGCAHFASASRRYLVSCVHSVSANRRCLANRCCCCCRRCCWRADRHVVPIARCASVHDPATAACARQASGRAATTRSETVHASSVAGGATATQRQGAGGATACRDPAAVLASAVHCAQQQQQRAHDALAATVASRDAVLARALADDVRASVVPTAWVATTALRQSVRLATAVTASAGHRPVAYQACWCLSVCCHLHAPQPQHKLRILTQWNDKTTLLTLRSSSRRTRRARW